MALLFSLLISSLAIAQWTRITEEYLGNEIANGFGSCVSLSDDGTVAAVGSFLYSGEFEEEGMVIVYKRQGENWVLQGDTLFGGFPSARLGIKIDLSGNGNRMICSFITNPRQARVYEWNGNEWSQLGQAILDSWPDSGFAISGDGNTVAVGMEIDDENGNQSGYCEVFQLNSENLWEPKGQVLYGVEGAKFGHSIDINWDGSRIAVGAPSQWETGVEGVGRSYVFEYNEVDNEWSPLGNAMSNPDTYEYAEDIAISNDGTRVANLSFLEEFGRWGAEVYELNDGNHTRIHEEIMGDFSQYPQEASLSLSGDGTVVAIGYPDFNSTQLLIQGNAGKFVVHKDNGNEWERWDEPIYGEYFAGYLGYDLELNREGNVLAVGAPSEPMYEYWYGTFTIWQNGDFVGIEEDASKDFVLYPNPTKGQLRFAEPYFGNIEVWNSMGQRVVSIKVQSTELDLSFLEEGIYLLSGDGWSRSQRVIISH